MSPSTPAGFATLDYAGKKKRTKRDVFLAEMTAAVPWSVLEAVIAPNYPKEGPQGGRRPFPIVVMLVCYASVQCLDQASRSATPSSTSCPKSGPETTAQCLSSPHQLGVFKRAPLRHEGARGRRCQQRACAHRGRDERQRARCEGDGPFGPQLTKPRYATRARQGKPYPEPLPSASPKPKSHNRCAAVTGEPGAALRVLLAVGATGDHRATALALQVTPLPSL